MPEKFQLDKIVAEGVTYRVPAAVGYVIKKVGTNSTTEAKLVLDDKPTGTIIDTISPFRPVEANALPPLDLGDLYYYLPEKRTLRFEGATGSKCRIIGIMEKYLPGEAPVAAHMVRYKEQPDKHLRYYYGYFEFPAGESWVDKREVEVFKVKPTAIETLLFNHYAMSKIENFSVDEGDIAITFKLEGAPLDVDPEVPPYVGIDHTSMPYPPNDTVGREPFKLDATPITVSPEVTLSVTATNVSGADIAPIDATVASYVRFMGVAKYERKVPR